jgi:C-terminal processing protease CtpA/Prc
MVYMPLRWTLLMFLCMAGMTWGQSATQPADLPSALADPAREQQIRQWLTELADPQATVRGRTREELMGLKAKELATLRAAIQETKSLEPSQAAVLREIVTQVYLAGRPYERSDSGFIGIRMDPDGPEAIVEGRLPGFPGYRWLRNGDVIVDIGERPMPQPMGQTAFIMAISNLKPGTTVHLKVLRQGKMIQVPVRLDARPAAKLDEDDAEYKLRVDAMMDQRIVEAQQYWRENFASLVDTSAKEP